jgi:hypothetical protein
MRHILLATAVLGAALLAMPAIEAKAGDFQTLPSAGADLRIRGTNSLATDPLFVDGFPTLQGYTLAASSSSAILVVEDDGTETLGTIHDAVFRNNVDNTLVFATRLEMITEDPPEPDLEINYIQRSGYGSYTAAAGWFFPDSGEGFRLRSVARTDQFFSNSAGALLPASAYNADFVTFNTDISIAESNPNSAWYAIKTNATQYAFMDGSLLIHQSEDGQIRNFYFNGLAPVPEPSEYAMMGLGMLLLGGVMRRRARKRV